MHRVEQVKRRGKHSPGRGDKLRGLRPMEEKLQSLPKKIIALSEKCYIFKPVNFM